MPGLSAKRVSVNIAVSSPAVGRLYVWWWNVVTELPLAAARLETRLVGTAERHPTKQQLLPVWSKMMARCPKYM